jgi:hypothetical protein
MAAQSERVRPDADASESRPIELITENGYSIVRLWELNDEPTPTGSSFTFAVSAVDGAQESVVVEISKEAIVEIEVHTRSRILSSNSFWIFCAERHLAAHLLEHGDCPPDGRLRVETLTPADFNLSIRWERT